jgi:tetratricopeptide (TPR) repeat protein
MRRLVLILGIVGVLAAVVVGFVMYRFYFNSPEKLLARAETALAAKKYDRAKEYALQAIAKAPDDWRPYDALSRVYTDLGSYEEARKALDEAAAHGGPAARIAIEKADTIALPGRRALESAEGPRQEQALKDAIAAIVAANAFLATAKAQDDAGALDIRQQIGLNLVQVGGAQKYLSNRLEQESEVAATSGNLALSDERHKASKAAAAESDKNFLNATGVLLDLVAHDPKRSLPMEVLINVAMKRDDPKTLAEVRRIVMAQEEPPVGPAVTLIMEDVRVALQKDAGAPAVLQAAGQRLDKMLKDQAKDPSVPDAMLARADVALRQNELDMADQLAQKVLEGSPTMARQIKAKLILGQVLMTRGKWEDAEKALNALKTSAHDVPAVQFAYARAAMALNKKELARAAMRAVTDLEDRTTASDPAFAEARKFLAESLLASGLAAEAYPDAKVFYDKHPDDPTAVSLFVTAAHRTKQDTAAREAAQAAAKNYPTRPDMLMAAYYAFIALGDRDSARAAAEKAADCKVATLAERLAQADAWVRLGRTSEAEKLLNDELVRTPRDSRIPMGLGRLYGATDRSRQAIEQFRAAVRLDDTNLTYHEALATQLYETGLFDECETELQAILARDDGDEAAKWLLSQLRGLKGEPAGAEQFTQSAAEGRASFAVAQTYLARGAAKECIDLCLKDLRATPSDQPMRILLGQAYLLLGQTDAAVAEWSKVLAAAPEQLPIYLQMAAALGRTRKADAVHAALLAIPGARADRVELAMGWLQERANDFEAAADVYGRLVARQDVPQDARNQARMLRARALGRAGHVDKALAELDQLATAPEWRNAALFNKASALALSNRPAEAEPVLVTLADQAVKAKDAGVLERIIGLEVEMKQFDRALAICDQYMTMLPDDARPCLARISVLTAAGRAADSVEWYRKAMERQPGNLIIPIHLARVLDSLDRIADAMAVLAQVENAGSLGKTAALFEKGDLFARLGLQPQAAACYEQLAQHGYAQDPAVLYLLGQSFAHVGRYDRAREVLRSIPEYAPQYVAARQALADLEPTDADKLKLLRDAEKVKPGEPSLYMHEMVILLQAKKPTEAVKVYEAAAARPVAPGGVGVPAGAHLLALQAMVAADNLSGAAALANRVAEESHEPVWRQLAALLTLDDNPQKARSLLREVASADARDAILGILVASRLGDSADPWRARLKQVEADMAKQTPPGTLPTDDRVLVALVAGLPAEAQAAIDTMPAERGLSHKVATELLAATVKDPKLALDAAQVLKATLAVELGVPQLGRLWAMKVLKASPAFQWAASMALKTDSDPALVKEVLQGVQPADSLFAKDLTAKQAVLDKQYDKAAQIWGALAEAEGKNVDFRINQAGALEMAGHLPEALAIYRDIWKATKDPVMANNAAFLITVLYPRDDAQLAEARLMIDAALAQRPGAPFFCDTAGWTAHLQHRPELAIQELRKAVRGLPDSPEVHYHMACAEEASKHDDMARYHYAAAVALCEKLKEAGALPATLQEVYRQAREALVRLK